MVDMIVHQRAFASPTALGGMMLLGEPEAGSAFSNATKMAFSPLRLRYNLKLPASGR
jgi:hypothetical protein